MRPVPSGPFRLRIVDANREGWSPNPVDLAQGLPRSRVAAGELVRRAGWKVDDLVFWDNRVTQHYAVADYLPERRVVYRATVNGDKPY